MGYSTDLVKKHCRRDGRNKKLVIEVNYVGRYVPCHLSISAFWQYGFGWGRRFRWTIPVGNEGKSATKQKWRTNAQQQSGSNIPHKGFMGGPSEPRCRRILCTITIIRGLVNGVVLIQDEMLATRGLS